MQVPFSVVAFAIAWLASASIQPTSSAPVSSTMLVRASDACKILAQVSGPPAFDAELFCIQDSCENECHKASFSFAYGGTTVNCERCKCGDLWATSCCQVVVTDFEVVYPYGLCDGSMECPETGDCIAVGIPDGDHTDWHEECQDG